ncbi:MAG: response regulator [Hyphomicrobiales bacterium]
MALQYELVKRPVRRVSPKRGPSKRVSAKNTKKLRILVVEDEVFVAHNICAVLESGGHEIVGMAATAHAAIKQAETFRPDLVMMDIRLIGDADGIDAALEIRRRFGIRCIFLTAFVDKEVRARAAEADPVDFLSKPFTPSALLSAVRKTQP